MEEQSQLDRKNINNGSGVNNNNSNEGEKTKEMVLGLPPKQGQTLSKAVEEAMVDEAVMARLVAQWQARQQARRWVPLAERLASNREAWVAARVASLAVAGGDGSGGGSNGSVGDFSAGDGGGGDGSGGDGGEGDGGIGDGSGGGGNGSGGDGGRSGGGSNGSGGDGSGNDSDCDGHNDGGDKTEGCGGGGGKMGTKLEPKGQHDNRNRFSYHGGDENGYLVGQLHSCYYQKPNVSTLSY